MGLTTWEAAPDGKIVKADVSIAKNYLNDKETSYMERIVSLYLDYAELQAERQIPMSMEDWAKRLDGFWSSMEMKFSQMQEKLVQNRQSFMQKQNLRNIGLCRTECLYQIMISFYWNWKKKRRNNLV